MEKLPGVIKKQLFDAALTARDLLESANNEAQRIREQARAEAYQQGLEAGRIEGLARLMKLCETISSDRIQANQGTTELALAIAGRLLEQELTLNPEAIQAVVEQQLNQIHTRKSLTLRVHPDHVATLEPWLKSRRETVTLVGDPRLSPGGCHLESRDFGIDGTFETRLELVRQALEAGDRGER